MVIDNVYEIGDIVYLKTDVEQRKRIVYRFLIYEKDVLYGVVCGVGESDHYGFELAKEKDVLIEA